jgi:hypothetical protein
VHVGACDYCLTFVIGPHCGLVIIARSPGTAPWGRILCLFVMVIYLCILFRHTSF